MLWNYQYRFINAYDYTYCEYKNINPINPIKMKLAIFLVIVCAASAFAGVRNTLRKEKFSLKERQVWNLLNFCFSITFVKQKVTPNADAMDKYMGIAKDCAAKEGASDADIQAAMSFKLPATKPGKCLNACVGEQIKVVSHITHTTTTTFSKITN